MSAENILGRSFSIDFHCPTFDQERFILDQGLSRLGLTSTDLKTLLLCRDLPYNLAILKLTMQYIKDTEMHNSF